MARSIDNSEDVIDSRDIESRIDELESDLDDFESARNEVVEALQDAEKELAEFIDSDEEDEVELARLQEKVREAQEAFDENEKEEFEDQDELDTLRELRDEVQSYSSEWRYGVTLIRDSYWVEYIEELSKEIGDMPSEIPSYIEIDWEATAENVKVDYSEVSYDGVDYYFRSC